MDFPRAQADKPPGWVLSFFSYVGSGPAPTVQPPPPKKKRKKYEEFQAPQKIFEILATPQNIHKIFIPPKKISFSENPQKYCHSNFEPQNIVQAYVCMEISEYPSGDKPWYNNNMYFYKSPVKKLQLLKSC